MSLATLFAGAVVVVVLLVVGVAMWSAVVVAGENFKRPEDHP